MGALTPPASSQMDAEWAAIEAKTSGKDVAVKAGSVSCLVGGALLGLSRSECCC